MQRVLYRNSVQDYRQWLTSIVSDIWAGAEVTNLEVTDEDPELAFTWKAEVEVPAPQAGNVAELMNLFPRATSGLETASLRRRELPVVYDHLLTLTYESTVRGLPPSTHLPPDSEVSGEGWYVATTTRYEVDAAKGHWEARLQRKRFEPDQFDELKSFWREARKSSSVVFSIQEGR